MLFNAPPTGEFSWNGVAWVGGALCLWATYLLTSRQLRQGRSVAVVMSHITPIAAVVTLPLGLFLFPGTLLEVTWRSVVFIVILAVLTGTVAHGLMVFAQKSVPIGVIACCRCRSRRWPWCGRCCSSAARWHAIQIFGMALVILGLVAVTIQTQRSRG